MKYMYLIRYSDDVGISNDHVKLVDYNHVEQTIKYLKFIGIENIKIYQVDFENELIALVAGNGEVAK